MEYKAENMEHELEICPITKQVFRHPVLASDGYHYELKSLTESELISPITGEPLTCFVYDLFLYDEMENKAYENRYPDYDKKSFLPLLTSYDSKLQSSFVALTCFFLSIAMKETTSPTIILSTLLTTGLTDYGFRLCSNHQFGFFGAAKKFWDVIGTIDPEYIRYGVDSKTMWGD